MKWYFTKNKDGNWKRVYKIKKDGKTLGKWLATPSVKSNLYVSEYTRKHANTTDYHTDSIVHIDMSEIGMSDNSPEPYSNTTTLKDINDLYYGAYLEIKCNSVSTISNSGNMRYPGWSSTTWTLGGQGQDVNTSTLFSDYSESSGKNNNYKVYFNVWNGAESGYHKNWLYFRPHVSIELHSTLTQKVHAGIDASFTITLWYWSPGLPDKDPNLSVSDNVWKQGQENQMKTNKLIELNEQKKELSIQEIEKSDN